MFERRLKFLLAALGFTLLILVVRLFQLQVVHADGYREEAARALLVEPQRLPFIRGTILDRTGRVLAQDQSCWDIRIDYPILTMDEDYLSTLAERYWRQRRYPEAASVADVDIALRQEIVAMWGELASFSALSYDELQNEAQSIIKRVEAIAYSVFKRHGYDLDIREERSPHTLLGGLDNQRQIEARTRFSRYPWVTVEDSARRVYPGGTTLAHVLGRMTKVDRERIENDPFAHDPLKCYLADETVGGTGIELSCETTLRGCRGRYRTDRAGKVVEDVRPVRGVDVRLTLRADLQEKLYGLLGSSLESPSRGGSIVVLDVAEREVLALVSYPSYNPERFHEDYHLLRNNTLDLPLSFRAVSNRFAPGSIVKPLTCLAGLSNGEITPETSFTCTGSLFPEKPDEWRCWSIAGTPQRMAHGALSVTEAITGSCNVFMYHVGEQLGVERLCQFYEMAGFGAPSGTGLKEEVKGINPSPGWLSQHRRSPVTSGDARNFSIGQGELSITPLQAANLAALYASGRHMPVTLVRHERPPGSWELPVEASHWRAVREGILGVTNSPSGTAYDYAHLDRSTGYALCGKTGSAETPQWHTSFRVSYLDADGHPGEVSIPAGSKRQALDEFNLRYPDITVSSVDIADEGFWPPIPSPEGKYYKHAWFVGYLQPLRPDGTPDYHREAPLAFSVFVEFGGSGSRTTGPIARDVCEILLETLGPDLDADLAIESKG